MGEKTKPEKISIENEEGVACDNSYMFRYFKKIPNTENMKYIGYARVSTKNQRIEEDSIEMQIQNIEAFCEKNNYILLSIYVDDGISRNKFEGRYGFQKMTKYLFKNEKLFRNSGGVITNSLSRIGGDMGDGVIFTQALFDRKINLKLIDKPDLNLKYDYEKSLFQMLFTTNAYLNSEKEISLNIEKDLNSEEIKIQKDNTFSNVTFIPNEPIKIKQIPDIITLNISNFKKEDIIKLIEDLRDCIVKIPEF